MGLIDGPLEVMRENLVIFVLSILIGIAGGLKIKTILTANGGCDSNDKVCLKLAKQRLKQRKPASTNTNTQQPKQMRSFFNPGVGSHD